MSKFYTFVLGLGFLLLPAWAMPASAEIQMPDIIIKEVVFRPNPLHLNSGETVTVDVILQNIGSSVAIVPADTAIKVTRLDTNEGVADWRVGKTLQIMPAVTATVSGLTISESTNLKKQIARIPLRFNFDTNYTVEESQRGNNSFDSTISTIGASSSDTQVPALRNLKITDVLETSAVVAWQTDETASTEVLWGLLEDNLNFAVTLPRLQDSLEHRVVLSGLRDGKKYFVRVRSRDLNNNLSESLVLNFNTVLIGSLPPLVLKMGERQCETDGRVMRIKFTTSLPATARLQYGLSSQYSDELSVDSQPQTSFDIALAVLAGTTYHYQVITKAPAGQVASSGDIAASCAVPMVIPNMNSSRPVIQSVIVENITKDSVTVRWQTDKVAKGRVEYGITSSYGELVLADFLDKEHRVVISSLQTGALYHYRIYIEDALTNWNATPDQTWQTVTLGPINTVTPAPTGLTGSSAKLVTAESPHVLISSPRSARQQSLATLKDGVALIWEDTRNPAEIIGLQFYDQNGQAKGSQIFLTQGPEATTGPEVVVLADKLLIAWKVGTRFEVAKVSLDGQLQARLPLGQDLSVTDYRWVKDGLGVILYWTGSNTKVLAQRFTEVGEKSGEIVTITTGANPWLFNGVGGLSLIWQQGHNVLFQFIDNNLQPREQPRYLIGVSLGSAVADSSGFSLLWTDQNQIWFARLDTTGQVIPGQRTIGEAYSLGDVSSLFYKDGEYAIAWPDHRLTREYFTLARWTKDGAVDNISTPLSSGTNSRPRLVSLDGGYFVTFQSFSTYSQIYGFPVKAISSGSAAVVTPQIVTTNMAEQLAITEVSVFCPARQIATVRWHTNKPSDSRVEFGKEIYYGAMAYGVRDAVEHEVNNIPVEPDTIYHYRIRTRTLAQPEVMSEDKILLCSSKPATTITVPVAPPLSVGQSTLSVLPVVVKKAPIKTPVAKKATPVKVTQPKITTKKPVIIKTPVVKVTPPAPAPVPVVKPVAPPKKSWWKIW